MYLYRTDHIIEDIDLEKIFLCDFLCKRIYIVISGYGDNAIEIYFSSPVKLNNYTYKYIYKNKRRVVNLIKVQKPIDTTAVHLRNILITEKALNFHDRYKSFACVLIKHDDIYYPIFDSEYNEVLDFFHLLIRNI